ncbi:5-methyltetrahydropteroyltriglutamate--homocysteine S-methyltransferase [Desulfovibrio sp. Huiquan2017]|uniref:5-methyltetrahydropteroyltriglutamate-- homocysteine S-methyltransferase n=1 Tax=Desulfovibrio sp. Huiquan2017 TaxID=2816861 RepID=UPI001A925CAA|nr:5-methyltetrahydropteroyltriglutamate--homocysteine S-methyltransferase [Desulfovibrio sp. Huiquan2017]
MTKTFASATTRDLPPFRADHVGSFLRPESVRTARLRLQAGEISEDDLRAAEDAAIRDLVEKQKACGLRAVTDGEFRRSWWHLDFFAGLDGLRKKTTSTGFAFHDVHTRAESVELVDEIRFGAHPMLEHFAFLRDCAGTHTAKMTIPSPAMLHFVLAVRDERFARPAFYPTENAFTEGIVQAYRDAVAAFYNAGCRYLQLDDTSWGALCSVEQRAAMRERGIDPDGLAERYVDILNAAIAERPADMTVTMHICRGNYRSTWFSSGGYEPVAPQLFANGRLDGFFLEYDTDRAGDFAPLRHIRDQQVVLGLVSSKTGELEKAEDVLARIDEAAAVVPINQLCLSPQCGFSSTEEGNTLSEEQQWAKIRFITELAATVWK